MIRTIIKIDEKTCNGCGACAAACKEGAIAMVDGKARLIRDDYCDGLGNCLPACPTGAISFEEREAAAYDHEAVEANLAATKAGPLDASSPAESFLSQWPVQIKLVPTRAPFYDGADLLIAADCTAYACKRFQEDFVKGRTTLIGCPKLDMTDYSEKLAEIFLQNDIRTVTVARMEVPCCRGIERAVRSALAASKKSIPCRVHVIGIDGRVF